MLSVETGLCGRFCVVELRVYIVRRGISYVPGYANKCSKIHGKTAPSLGAELASSPRRDMLVA